MNKFYSLLFCSMALSCMTEYSEEDFSKCHFQEALQFDFDRIVFQKLNENLRSNCISESIFFKANFDQEWCKRERQSHPQIDVYFEKKHFYFVSTRQLQSAHSLSYSDIDDYYASIEEPLGKIGRIGNYSILKIPIQSNVSCVDQVSTILLLNQECLDRDEDIK